MILIKAVKKLRLHVFVFLFQRKVAFITVRNNLIIIKSLDPLRAKKALIRKKLGHTAVSAIKASSVTLWQKEPDDNAVNLQILTWQSSERLI